MRHIIESLRYYLFIAVLLYCSSFIATDVIRFLIADSGYRLAMAGNAERYFSGQKIVMTIGDSRMMDGFNADLANRLTENRHIFNAAFNGLHLSDIIAITRTFFHRCECQVETVIVNAGSLLDDTDAASDIEIFMTNFYPELLADIEFVPPVKRYALLALPLLHFNNEAFLRSSYYRLRGFNDQNHGNQYSFRISEQELAGLGRAAKRVEIDRERFRQLQQLVSAHGARLAVVVTPPNAAYLDHRLGFRRYVSELGELITAMHADFYDLSAALYTQRGIHSDLIHLNTRGQTMFTELVVERVVGR